VGLDVGLLEGLVEGVDVIPKQLAVSGTHLYSPDENIQHTSISNSYRTIKICVAREETKEERKGWVGFRKLSFMIDPLLVKNMKVREVRTTAAIEGICTT